MRTLIGILLIGIAAVILSGIFFVARPVMAIVRGTAVSPASPITQTLPTFPTPFATSNTGIQPNAQYQGVGQGMDRGNWGMREGNWNMQDGMMGAVCWVWIIATGCPSIGITPIPAYCLAATRPFPPKASHSKTISSPSSTLAVSPVTAVQTGFT